MDVGEVLGISGFVGLKMFFSLWKLVFFCKRSWMMEDVRNRFAKSVALILSWQVEKDLRVAEI